MSVSAFVTQHAWLLGDELGLPPAAAQALFLEIFEATTPTMLDAAIAVTGMQEKLGCSPQIAAAVARLWTKNQGMSPHRAVAEWEGGDERGAAKVQVEVLKRRRKRVGWWDVVKVAVKQMLDSQKSTGMMGMRKIEWRARGERESEKIGWEVHGHR